MNATTKDKLIAIAARLAEQAGRPRLRELVQLKGGRNNRVFRMEMEAGEPLALKVYFANPGDTRDRLAAEWAFLKYAWSHQVRTIPEPLAIDRMAHAALYSFVPGEKLTPDQIGENEVDAASDFVIAVNAPPRDVAALGAASEACFSLTEHLGTVERRVERLNTLDTDTPLRDDAERLVGTRLRPLWQTVRSAIVTSAAQHRLSAGATLGEDSCCLSPSDFGFHNALRDVARNALTFLDFEYAGRDDPAKLVCDFFCQPETPVPLTTFDRFLQRLALGLNLDSETQTRARLLLDAYRIKWACILLNEFLPIGAARRAFAEADDRNLRCAAQLRKAEAMLAQINL
jgi:hypothetical protein